MVFVSKILRPKRVTLKIFINFPEGMVSDMSAVSEILSILEKLPVWRRISSLPDEVDSLKKRITELESKLSGSGDKCPKCGEFSFRVESSRPHPTFGELGGIERIYVCDRCHYSESKLIE